MAAILGVIQVSGGAIATLLFTVITAGMLLAIMEVTTVVIIEDIITTDTMDGIEDITAGDIMAIADLQTTTQTTIQIMEDMWALQDIIKLKIAQDKELVGIQQVEISMAQHHQEVLVDNQWFGIDLPR